MRLWHGSAALLLLSPAWATTFNNPPPPGAIRDYSNSPTYVLDSEVELSWTRETKEGFLNLVLWQVNVTTGHALADFVEYAAATDYSEFPWTVKTKKNLTVSNVFFFSLFVDGMVLAGNSHYFNIVTNGNSTVSTPGPPVFSTAVVIISNFITTSFTGSHLVLTATSTPPVPNDYYTGGGEIVIDTTQPPSNTGSSGLPTNATAPTSHTHSSSGLPTSVTVGIAVAIPVSLLLGAIAGSLLFGRRRRLSKLHMGPPIGQGMSGDQWDAARGSASQLWGRIGADGAGKQQHPAPVELSASPVAELPAPSPILGRK